ncbi:HD family phosphohydrolase [Virgibacillus sp. MG-45]|uniref:HD family phosphohydrolase n=1 Tax=Virgibacillus sp. MG-45 TaxID=3102791 RepID=UPI002EDA4263
MKSKIVNAVRFIKRTRSKWVTVIVPCLLLGAFLFLISLDNIYTKTLDIERFNNAKETIRSPITIENEQETERKTREAVQSVEDRFDISTEITAERVAYVEEIFDAITKLEAGYKAEKTKEESPISTQEKLMNLKQILSAEITENVNDSLLVTLIETPKKDRDKGEEVFVPALKKVMEKGVRVENINSAMSEIKQRIKYSSLNDNLKKALQALSEFAVIDNSFFDAKKTMEAQKEAAANVEPVVIRAGEIIVREGQTITNEKYEELQLVGLLNNERNVYPLVGLAFFVLLIVSIIGYEAYILDKRKQLNLKKMTAILLISIFVITLMKVVSIYTTQTNQLYLVVPVATGVLLLKQLLNERLAIVYASLFSIIATILFNGEIAGSLNMEAGIYFFFSQIAAIIFLANPKDRLAVIKAGIGMSVINMLAILLFLFLSFEKYAFSSLMIQLGFGVSSAFLSAVLTIGLLPFFETGLNILTDMKLLQLSSPNQPLLKKILLEAPGTYHHSVMVANLSETACDAIGANGLLARVGAYYHDIGKTLRPHYFIENQLAISNPHDRIAPKESAEIIISHPYDGADMLKKYKLPREIIDIAMQHHGTSLLKFFYYKEKEQNPDVLEADYRYPGPKPQTKEAAIICICDSVEAAVRSLQEPTKEKIDDIVASIVNDRLLDGQFDECPITIKELNEVHRVIQETLKGIFHSRIQYPMKEAN